jgi:hypothetical protein
MDKYDFQYILVALVFVYPIWNINKRAGLNPLFVFTIFIPPIGWLIYSMILAFSEWDLSSEGEDEE